VIVVLAVRRLPRVRLRQVPPTLIGFLALAALSIAWSFYPGASALGVLAQVATTIAGLFLALCLTWAQLWRALAVALRILLGASLLFEIVVAVFVRQPVLPLWVDYEGKVPAAFYWSRDLLFSGGPIQGVVGNRNLLGFLAALALIVFAAQLAAGWVTRRAGWFWIGVAVACLALTRSATVLWVLVAVGIVLAFALWTRQRPPGGRRPVYLTALAVVIAGIIAVIALWSPLLTLLGKSDDGTGRLQIWSAVAELAGQRPWFGWGWVSYWAPWAEPFDDLAVRGGVTYLQAHDAWLDVWLQLGILGLVLIGLLVVGVLWRSWFIAVDRPHDDTGAALGYRVSALLPLLVAVALVAQSVAESRLLVEGGWLLLVALAVKTNRQQQLEERLP